MKFIAQSIYADWKCIYTHKITNDKDTSSQLYIKCLKVGACGQVGWEWGSGTGSGGKALESLSWANCNSVL